MNQSFSGTIATFQDANVHAPLSDFTATINWGDGQSGQGVVSSLGNGAFAVTATHTWTQQGSFPVTVTINDVGGSSATATRTADVADLPLDVTGGFTIDAVAGTAFTDQVVATFQDPGGAEPLPLSVGDPDFEAPSVGSGSYADYLYDPTGSPWTFSGGAGVAGNGSGFTSGNPDAPQGTQVAFLQSSTGSISQSLDFEVPGSYVVSFQAAQRGNYQVGGNQTIEVLLDGTVVGTITPSGTSYATYSTEPFAVTAGDHTLTFEGTNSGESTAFLDGIAVVGADDPNPYTATIDWGDGNTSAGIITYDGLEVLGSHTYNAAGTYLITVSVRHDGNPAVTVQSTVQVAGGAERQRAVVLSRRRHPGHGKRRSVYRCQPQLRCR